MLRVRFATGLVVQYNNASKLQDAGTNAWHLVTHNDSWVATVGKDALVEAVEPCSVSMNGSNAIGDVLTSLRLYTAYTDLRKLAELKLALRDFNAQHKVWR